MNSKPSNPVIDLTIDPGLLKDNCVRAENQDIRVDFTEEQLTEMKKEYFQLSSQLQNRSDAESAAKLAIGSGLEVYDALTNVAENTQGVDYGEGDTKSLKARIGALLRTINHGYEIREEKLFGMDYQEISRMAWYDETGIFVYDRPLTPTEKQTNILSMNRTGTNG